MSLCLRILAPISQFSPKKGMCHLSHVTCHLSPDHNSIQFQLLWYLVYVAAGGLGIDKDLLLLLPNTNTEMQVLIEAIQGRTYLTRSLHTSPPLQNNITLRGQTSDKQQTDIATYRLNRLKRRFSETWTFQILRQLFRDLNSYGQ